MMEVIYKYHIRNVKEQILMLPIGAKIIHVHHQFKDGMIWAQINPKAKLEERKFELVGTGHDFDPKNKTYLGTIHLDAGNYVFHLYDVGN